MGRKKEEETITQKIGKLVSVEEKLITNKILIENHDILVEMMGSLRWRNCIENRKKDIRYSGKKYINVARWRSDKGWLDVYFHYVPIEYLLI